MGDTKTGDIEIPDVLRGKTVDGLPTDTMPDELRGKTPDELMAFATVLDGHLRSLHQTDEGELRELTDEEQQAFDYGMAIRQKVLDKLDEHRKIAEVFTRKPKAVERAISKIRYGEEAFTDVRRLPVAEARDRALRVLDNRVAAMHLTDAQKTHVERSVRRYTDVARRIVVTETDAYRGAFQKALSSPQGMALWDDDERNAMRAFEEYRAMAEGAGSTGGFGVPVFIDPSIILTDQESDNPFLLLARQVTVTTNAWKGVSAAGVTWSFDAEAAAVSDDSPTLAQPNVGIHTARGFIPYSIEVEGDYPGFAEEMSGLLGAGYDELLLDKFTRGSGNGEPDGLITALDRSTSGAEVLITTAGLVGAIDIYNAWKALRQKYRRRAAWLMSVDMQTDIEQFGTTDAWYARTKQLPEGALDVLRNKPVYEDPYFADFTGTTGHQNALVVGDFQNYVVARRAGMTIELVPHVFDVTNNRPTGQRGWFGHARIGGGVVNPAGFKLLNQT